MTEMGAFGYGVIKVNGQRIVVDSFTAMYHNAQQRGDQRLMRILEYRAEKHDGGECNCVRGCDA